MIPLWLRVWSKVRLPAHPNSCILWRAATSKKRRTQRRAYIHVGPGKRVAQVHRVVCTWFHGPPPADRPEAGHTCPTGETALCINPLHLRWMSRLENERHKRRRPRIPQV